MYREYELSLKLLSTLASVIGHLLLALLLFLGLSHLEQSPFSSQKESAAETPQYIPLVQYNQPPPQEAQEPASAEQFEQKQPLPEDDLPPAPAETETYKKVTDTPTMVPIKKRQGKSAWISQKSVYKTSHISPDQQQRKAPFDGTYLHNAFGNFMQTKQHEQQKNMNNIETKTAFDFALEAYNRKMIRVMKDTAAYYRRTVHIPQQLFCKALVSFELLTNGSITNLNLLQPTGNKDIDAGIIEFFNLFKFPPLPKAITDIRSSLIINSQVQIRQVPGVRDLQFTVDSFW